MIMYTYIIDAHVCAYACLYMPAYVYIYISGMYTP